MKMTASAPRVLGMMSGMATIVTGDGVELAVDDHGTGSAVVLIHGSPADALLPLMSQPALADYRLIRYHRRGHGESPPAGPTSIAEHARDCRALLAALEVTHAHVVGYSLGGNIALQFAVDNPDMVDSLVLLEPAVFAGPTGAQFGASVRAIMGQFAAGDIEGAVEAFWSAAGGPSWRADMIRTLPGGPAQLLRDAPTFFAFDGPATRDWQFDANTAASIDRPTLYVHGSDSSALAEETRDMLQEWLPDTSATVVPGANHLLQMQRPAETADVIAVFLDRHPVTA